MGVESASEAAPATSGANRARQVWLPPLWPFAALAALMLLRAAASDPGDMLEYHCYALDFWQGAHAANAALALPQVPHPCDAKIPGLASQPFHQLPREYGPLSLLAFFLPLLAPTVWYNTVFSALMCVAILALAWLLQRYGPRGAGHIWLLYTLLGTMLVATGRFDVLPAAAALIALLAAQRGRSLLAYAALAIGTLLKYYPLALLPLLLVWSWRRRREEPLWRGPALFAGITLAGEAVAALMNPLGALAPLGFMSARCTEVEAFPATLSYLWASLTGGHVSLGLSQQYSSLCQFSPDATTTQTIAALLGLAGLVTVFWLYWRGRLNLAPAFILATGAVILGAKVFSTQYLLWLSPLIAYAYGLEASALIGWGLVCLVTTLYYPVAISPWVLVYLGKWLYNHTQSLIAVRNLLMLVVGGLALRDALRNRGGTETALAAGEGQRE